MGVNAPSAEPACAGGARSAGAGRSARRDPLSLSCGAESTRMSLKGNAILDWRSSPWRLTPPATDPHPGDDDQEVPVSSRYPMSAVPRSWYAVAFSSEVPPASLRTVRAFGRELLLLRGASGVVSALDPHCGHLGAHLGDGTVQGDTVQCPFHGWRWDGQGRCVEVPYAAKVPGRARIQTTPVKEQNGVILAWSEPDVDPSFEIPALDEAGWSSTRTVEWTVSTHVQEVLENSVDWAHFGPVHRMREPSLVQPTTPDGATLTTVVGFLAPGEVIGMPGIDSQVENTFACHGLGVLLITTRVLNVGLEARERLYATPIDGERIAIRVGVEMRRLDDAERTEELAEIFYRSFVADIPRDFPIWERKAYLERPVLAAGERGFSTFRRWARQFYEEPAGAVEGAEAPGHEEGPARAGAEGPGHDEGSSRAAGQTAPDHGGPGSRWSLGRVQAEVLGLRDRVVGAVQSMRGLVVRPSDGAETAGAFHSVAEAQVAPQQVAPSRGTTAPESTPSPPRKVRPAASSVSDYFETLPARFVASASIGLDAVFQWDITGNGGGTWHAVVQHGALTVAEGPHPSPNVTLTVGAGDYVEMVNGRLNGMLLFTTGRAKIAGDISLAMRMQSLFPAG
ncbi:MAG: hypothetical protein AMXMBFR64_50600 [Myxococcales bacterium]